jgi:lipid-A-disaccharide synthase-like uncharacterized protein
MESSNPGEQLFVLIFILNVLFVIQWVYLSKKLKNEIDTETDGDFFWYSCLQKSIIAPSYYKKFGDNAYQISKNIRGVFLVYFIAGFSSTAYVMFSHI